MTRQRKLGDVVGRGQVVPCPRCEKRHRVLAPSEESQKLNFIRCNGDLIVVGIEGRYLPAVPQIRP
jgi:hypothetical protein